MRRPVIYISDILAWADAFYRRVRRWPCRNDGPVRGSPEYITWSAVNQALKKGWRGLPGGQSLPKLLLEHRGHRHRDQLPSLTVEQVLAWADAHHERTGRWPAHGSGRIPEAPLNETWLTMDKALRRGKRGLPSCSSLAKLLKLRRDVRNCARLAPLKPEQVLAWADAFHKRTGRWPKSNSGPVARAPGETWAALDAAFVAGKRGLGGYGSLARFLAQHRGVRNIKALPNLTVKQIRKWVRAYYEREGRWPTHTSGPILEAPGENWGGIHNALRNGWRGLPRGSSLYRVRGR